VISLRTPNALTREAKRRFLLDWRGRITEGIVTRRAETLAAQFCVACGGAG
jgi:hypothetical protein